jgi:hypothetical protein
MDHFTPAQVQILQVGGNAQCNQYLAGETIPAKYDSAIAQTYKQWLQAKAQGDTKAMEQYEATLVKQRDQKESLGGITPIRRMDFTNTTPPPSIPRAFLSSFKFMMSLEVDRYGSVLVGSVVSLIGAAAAWSLSHKNSTLQRVLWGGGCGSIIIMLSFVTMGLRRHRAPAFKSAVKDFSDRVHAGRAKRNPNYDIFFPPNVSIGATVETALVFYPGVLVDFMAYSILLGKISDAGILAILVNTEPSRVACSSEGYNTKHLNKIFFEIQTLLGIQVGHWALGGHSLGALTAAKLANQLGPDVVHKCVLWGSGLRYFYSHVQDQANIQVLTVDASNDRIVLDPSPPGTLEELRQAAKTVPSQHVLIEGGNHAGFGHYGPQIFPRKDGDRVGITLDEQHEKILSATIDFLKGTKESKQD